MNKPYQIVLSNSIEGLMEDVNIAIENGYIPIGGVCVGMFHNYQQAMFKKPTKTVKPRASKTEYVWEFDNHIWKDCPKRAGGNPKRKAYSAYLARISEDGKQAHFTMRDGLYRYRAFCDATGKTGTEYVMQAATFFGPDRHYENDWKVPVSKDPAAIDSGTHDKVDFQAMREAEQQLDPVDPYADLKGKGDE